jgi:hypothetical protein
MREKASEEDFVCFYRTLHPDALICTDERHAGGHGMMIAMVGMKHHLSQWCLQSLS